MKIIETLAELRALRIRPFPIRPRASLRMLRFDDTIVAVDDRRDVVYSNRVHGRERSLAMLRTRAQADVAIALGRLGLVAAGVDAELEAESAAEQQRSDASYALGNAKDLERLGVPYTKSQLRRLRAMAGVES